MSNWLSYNQAHCLGWIIIAAACVMLVVYFAWHLWGLIRRVGCVKDGKLTLPLKSEKDYLRRSCRQKGKD